LAHAVACRHALQLQGVAARRFKQAAYRPAGFSHLQEETKQECASRKEKNAEGEIKKYGLDAH